MGTTVTTNLGLIKPDENEKIKQDLPDFAGWADQNADNCDVLDSLFRKDTGTYSLNFRASSVNPTLGAGGFTEGKYVRLWPKMVIAFFRISTGGAGFLTGTGDYRIDVPFDMDPDLIASDGGRTLPIGKAIFNDASAVLTSSVFLALFDPVGLFIEFELAQGDILSNTFPLAQGDQISGYVMYPTKGP